MKCRDCKYMYSNETMDEEMQYSLTLPHEEQWARMQWARAECEIRKYHEYELVEEGIEIIVMDGLANQYPWEKYVCKHCGEITAGPVWNPMIDTCSSDLHDIEVRWD